VEDGYEEREGLHPLAEAMLRHHQAKQGREEYERMQVGREEGREGGREGEDRVIFNLSVQSPSNAAICSHLVPSLPPSLPPSL